jgi:DNA mismatch repair ATPase MutL
VELSTNDFVLIKELLPEFKLLGFDLAIFGKNNIAVNGCPSDLEQFNVKQMIEGILETFKLNTLDHKIEKHDNLCRAMARNACIKYGKILESSEIKLLVSNLLHCENYLHTAGGKTIMLELSHQEIEKHFKK